MAKGSTHSMKVQFVKSALFDKDWAELLDDHGKPLPEVAVVGRSNVGKSSLLNHLFQNKNVAKVSAKPGKTQLLNFFLVDERFALVDCPGYGYAKVPKKMQIEWGKWVERYLEERPSLKLILFLLDLRRTPNEDDFQFFKWAAHYNKDMLVVITKADKCKKNERKKQVEHILSKLEQEGIVLNRKPLLYTIKNSEGRITLSRFLQSYFG